MFSNHGRGGNSLVTDLFVTHKVQILECKECGARDAEHTHILEIPKNHKDFEIGVRYAKDTRGKGSFILLLI